MRLLAPVALLLLPGALTMPTEVCEVMPVPQGKLAQPVSGYWAPVLLRCVMTNGPISHGQFEAAFRR